jgi:nicotinate-nucleotide adenylyltransferase
MPQRIGLYGGSFDPIHFGHLISARAIAEQLGLQKIILIPAARPPHKKDRSLSPAQDRLQMTRLAVNGDELFDVSDVELHRDGPSYSIDTVMELREALPLDVQLFWIIGADTLPELRTWHRANELVQVVQFVTAARPGWCAPSVNELSSWAGQAAAEALMRHCCPTPDIQISATDIRARVRDGRPIRYFLPENVRSYISDKSLYVA